MLAESIKSGFYKEIRRERRLPDLGEVLVNEGQQVEPADVIARMEMVDEILLIDLADSLGIKLGEVEGSLVRQPGEILLKDDVIAWVEGAIPRLVRAPINGKFVTLHRGCAVFEVCLRTFEVKAGMQGVVESIIPGYGATLLASGLVLQGFWGNGSAGAGRLRVLPLSWFGAFEKSMVPAFDSDEIIVLGGTCTQDVLAYLGAQNPAGLVLGSIESGLIKEIRGLNFPVVILDGFGELEPNPWVLETLQPLDGKTTSLNATLLDRLTGMRPELMINLEDGSRDYPQENKVKLRVGQKVRLFSGKQSGKLGKIIELLDVPYHFACGIELPAVSVKLTDGEKVKVPQQNVIVLH